MIDNLIDNHKAPRLFIDIKTFFSTAMLNLDSLPLPAALLQDLTRRLKLLLLQQTTNRWSQQIRDSRGPTSSQRSAEGSFKGLK